MKYTSDNLSSALYQARQSRINESTEGVTGDTSDIAVYEEQVNENPKIIKCSDGELQVKKHLLDLRDYDVYSVKNLDYNTDGILITDEYRVYCFLTDKDAEKLKSKI